MFFAKKGAQGEQKGKKKDVLGIIFRLDISRSRNMNVPDRCSLTLA